MMSTADAGLPAATEFAIVGAGPSGLALALALDRSLPDDGPRVTLIGSPPALRPDGPARAYALARTSCTFLESVGVWPAIACHAQAMERVVVSDGRPAGSQLSLLEFEAETGPGPSAHLVEETVLLPALVAAVEARPRIVWRHQAAAAAGLSTDADTVTVVLDDGTAVTARLVIGADGRTSRLRRLARIKSIGWDYGQSGLVAAVTHDKPHNGVAVERFLPAGPFAILPLTGNRSSLVWTESTLEAARLRDADEATFRAALSDRFGTERGRVLSIGPRATFPLNFHIARSFVGDRLALVGDAAHAVHPLAGQGFNLGLRDAAALAECVAQARGLGLDPGASTVLERYQRWRRFDTVTAALTYDGLNRLFSNDRDGLRAIRDVGLGIVERLPFLKTALLREAAGTSGAVPELMAGRTPESLSAR